MTTRLSETSLELGFTMKSHFDIIQKIKQIVIKLSIKKFVSVGWWSGAFWILDQMLCFIHIRFILEHLSRNFVGDGLNSDQKLDVALSQLMVVKGAQISRKYEEDASHYSPVYTILSRSRESSLFFQCSRIPAPRWPRIPYLHWNPLRVALRRAAGSLVQCSLEILFE